MMSGENVQLLCAGLLGAFFYLRLLLMFYDAALRGIFSFRLGEIHGKPARAIGILGLMGLASALYLRIGIFLGIRPPLWPIAGFFLALAVMMVLAVALWGIVNLVWWRK